MRRPLVAALILVGTAACSYIFELPETTTAPIEPGGEGGLEDVSVAEASTPPPYVPPPSVPFCETQAAPFLYCNDFDDDPAPDLATIGAVQVTEGGQLLFSNAVALSFPRSLLATARGTNAAAAITRDLGTNPDGVTLSFDLLVSAWTTTDAQLAELVLTDPGSQCVVRIGGTATTWTVTQVCTAGGAETARVTNDSTTPIARGRWQRYRLGIVFAPTKNVFLEIDGTRVLEVPGAAPLQRAPTSIGLGAKSVTDGSVTLFHDNVLVTSP